MKDKPKTDTAPSGNAAASPATPRPCPICRQPAVARFRPFCSRRCADIDLGRWFKGSYAIRDEDGGAELAGTGRDEGDE